MPPHPAFLSCVLRLQIRDRNLCCCDAIAARAFRPAGKCRGVSEVLAFRRLQIPARDIKSGGWGYDNARAHRKHTAVVRTPARRIGSAIAVNQGAASFQSAVSLLFSEVNKPPLVGNERVPILQSLRRHPFYSESSSALAAERSSLFRY